MYIDQKRKISLIKQLVERPNKFPYIETDSCKNRKFPFEPIGGKTGNFPLKPIASKPKISLAYLYSCKKRKIPLETDSFKNRKLTLKTDIYIYNI